MKVPHRLYWTLLTLSCFGQYLGQDLQLPELFNGAVGGSVLLAPDNPPSSTSILITQWLFTTLPIITVANGVATVNTPYEGRVSFNKNTLALELRGLTLNDTGRYRLTITPNAGLQFEGETSLQVYDQIYDVRLIGPEESLIEGNSSANITSEGTGSITSVQWIKDNSPLSPSDRIIFSSDNKSVSISPVQRSDSGEYQCTYTNPFSSDTATLSLTINYGPEHVSIKGPDKVDLEDSVSLSCSADSEPSALFSWTFNGTDTSVTTDTFTINETNFTDSGDYECTAWNSVTKKSDSKRHTLLVEIGGEGGEEGGGGGLTTGAIVGIVIGVLVAVAGICGLIVYLTKTKKIPKPTFRQKERPSGAAQSRREPELNYADVSHFQKASGERVILGSRSEPQPTEYAEVKHGAKSKAPLPPYGSQESNPPLRR